MAKLGENWVEEVLSNQGYQISKVGNLDCLAFKDNLALIIEEKDNKYPIKVGKTRVYTLAGKRKRFPFKLKQMNKHLLQTLETLKKANAFFNIIQVYVVSNMVGRYVCILRHYKGNIFFINKGYFPVWLKHLEYVYLGSPEPFKTQYMGGK